MSDDTLFDILAAGCTGGASALRAVTRLVPSGGPADKVFPPTHEQGRYAEEIRRDGEREVKTVLLDSVQSQANRMEEALLHAYDRGECPLPLLMVDIPPVGRITTLDAPHRIADAIFRDCLLDDEPFRRSPIGRGMEGARTTNATPIFESCPTALIFGMWDSQGSQGGLGAKFARALVSEIVGFASITGVRTQSRIDPLGIKADAGPVYESATDQWTLDEPEAVKEKGKPRKYGKDGKPASINHGNVVPTIKEVGGGVTISHALQTSVLSFPALRRLRFPETGGAHSTQRDVAARTVLASLAIYAMLLQQQEGYDLRSRCLLWPNAPTRFELLGAGGDVRTMEISTEIARECFLTSIKLARTRGLSWSIQPSRLRPSDKLLKLVKRSLEVPEAVED